MNNKIIGNGSQGYIIKPPINSTDQNFVGKVGTYDNLMNEYTMIQKFPIEGPYLLNSLDFTVTLEKLNNEDLELITNVFNHLDVYQMIIPYVYGTPLDQLFDNNVYMNSVNNWIDQLKALLVLKNDISILNQHQLYHNDIDISNIIYNDMEKKMYLIDFGLASTEDEDDIDESASIDEIIKLFISGILNRSPVKEWVLIHNICTLEYDTLYYMFENTLKRNEFGQIIGLNFKKYTKLANNHNSTNDFKDMTQNFINNNSEKDIVKHLFNIELKQIIKNLDLNNLNIALEQYMT